MKSMLTLLAYSHTDFADVWPAFFGRIKRYMPNYKLIFLTNRDHKNIPVGVKKIFYDDNYSYTDRLNYCVSLIDEEVVLFMHEDMILYSAPLYKDIEKYCEYIKSNVFDSIKLLHVGDDAVSSTEDENLFYGYFSRFSIQPTIIKTATFAGILEKHKNLSIWEFEYSIDSGGRHVMCRKLGSRKRGIFHYDSDVLPYMATGIVKGKWNTTEYPKELKEISIEYCIDLNVRGTI